MFWGDFTILPSTGTWACRCGQLLQSSVYQWPTLTHWFWPEYLHCSLCHNWRVLSSSCSCPLEKNEKESESFPLEKNEKESGRFLWEKIREKVKVVLGKEWEWKWKQNHLYQEQLAIFLIRFIEAVWSLVTSGDRSYRRENYFRYITPFDWGRHLLALTTIRNTLLSSIFLSNIWDHCRWPASSNSTVMKFFKTFVPCQYIGSMLKPLLHVNTLAPC